MSQAITISDVARLAGVSAVTVSKTLNGQGRISEMTRARVLKAADDLGYVANFAARSLAGGRTNVLGMLIQDLGTQYFSEIARAAAEATDEAGLDLLLYTMSHDPSRERERAAALTSGLSDGLLILLPRSSGTYFESLRKSRVPVVLINHPANEGLPSVRADNYQGAREAIRHLVSLGHTRIGYVSGDARSNQNQDRFQAYQDGLSAAGLPYDGTLVRPGDFTRPRGFTEGRILLELPQPPTAIFAANDLTAYGVIDAIKDRGLRVPDQVSVVGFDDIPTSSEIHPALTTVRHPLHQIGHTATQLLLDLLARKEEVPRHIVLPSELIVRASTGPAAPSPF